MTATISPRLRRSTPGPLRVYRTHLLAYRRTWRGSLTTSFLFPMLYLAAIGVGLGKLVKAHGLVDGVSYIDFLAPGLLAATAMQIGANESTYPIMAGIKWLKTYGAMLATPLETTDVLYGTLLWIASRVAMASALFLAVMALFGTVHSFVAVLAFPAAVLTGAAFSAPVVAFSATRETDQSFVVLYRVVVVPLFLFSGTFYPVSQLPGALQAVAVATPLFQGVALTRALTLGHLGGWAMAGHAGYLVALVVAGVVAGRWSFRRRLVN